MYRDESDCNTYNYGDALYWDARYIQEAGCGPFDWYQRYAALRPFVRKYIPTASRVLMVGCGNAVMSEDMVKDGYEEIVNVDISSVAIDMMRRKHEHIPELQYMQMDVRDMSFFPDESFDSVIDKGTLDSLMCGTNAPISASQMLGEVSRLLKPGGVYMLITYGDPTVRMPHLNRPVYNWKIELYNIQLAREWAYLSLFPGSISQVRNIDWRRVHNAMWTVVHGLFCCSYMLARPGFQKSVDSTSGLKSYLEPVPLTEASLLPADYVMEDPDSHFIYICKKPETRYISG